MMAVIFELEPKEGKRAEYLDTAAALKSELELIEGFVSIERFESLGSPGKLLSLSFFEDEAAVKRWRTYAAHRAAQQKGRSRIFTDYRLRVAEVKRDYGMFDRDQVPTD